MRTRPVTPKSCVTLIDDRVGALEASIVWCRGSLAGVAFLPETAPEVVQKLRAVLAALEEAEARRMPQGPQPPPIWPAHASRDGAEVERRATRECAASAARSPR
jgi:hypothetical protein